MTDDMKARIFLFILSLIFIGGGVLTIYKRIIPNGKYLNDLESKYGRNIGDWFKVTGSYANSKPIQPPEGTKDANKIQKDWEGTHYKDWIFLTVVLFIFGLICVGAALFGRLS